MASEDLVPVDGKITEVLPGGRFRIKPDEGEMDDILAHLSGKMRQNKIRLVLGDQVKLEVSPYDATRGRIVRRL